MFLLITRKYSIVMTVKNNISRSCLKMLTLIKCLVFLDLVAMKLWLSDSFWLKSLWITIVVIFYWGCMFNTKHTHIDLVGFTFTQVTWPNCSWELKRAKYIVLHNHSQFLNLTLPIIYANLTISDAKLVSDYWIKQNHIIFYLGNVLFSSQYSTSNTYLQQQQIKKQIF